MKINFTKKEYQLLLDMIYLSDWMMHSHETPGKSNGYKELRKKILSYYKEMDASDRIEHGGDDYYETRDQEDEMHEKFIAPYDDQTFWEELIDRLGRRDAINKIGLEAFMKMDFMDRATILDETTEPYGHEFEEHGLENLKIQYNKSVIN